jgi:hypothetical protein
MINYKKEKKIKIPSQNVKIDPRGKNSIFAPNAPLPTGDKVTVKGVGKARKQTATWY